MARILDDFLLVSFTRTGWAKEGEPVIFSENPRTRQAIGLFREQQDHSAKSTAWLVSDTLELAFPL